MKKITPFLWFNDQAEEAMNFYVSIFKNSKVLQVAKGPGGKVMSVSFELDGQEFMAINGGPHFTFTEAISLFVNCQDQREVNELWEKLSVGGSEGQCGWLKDKYGLSWQVIPVEFGQMLNGSDPVKTKKMLDAMMSMQKLDIAKLKQAYDS